MGATLHQVRYVQYQFFWLGNELDAVIGRSTGASLPNSPLFWFGSVTPMAIQARPKDTQCSVDSESYLTQYTLSRTYKSDPSSEGFGFSWVWVLHFAMFKLQDGLPMVSRRELPKFSSYCLHAVGTWSGGSSPDHPNGRVARLHFVGPPTGRYHSLAL